MTITEALRQLSSSLTPLYDKREAENIADIVIEKITGLKRIDRILHKELLLSPEQKKHLETYTTDLLQHKPLQYVLQEAWFYGLPLFVNEYVLIPRPETEELVEWILSDIKSLSHPSASILDIGTGSGCIPVAFKKNVPAANLTAIDISKEALHVAKKNADANNVVVDYLQVDALKPEQVNMLPHFDIIISNPPYIPVADKHEMRSNVLDYEPHTALFVEDEKPLLFYNAISTFAATHLNANGYLYFEIHESMGEAIKELLEKDGFSNIMVRKDMQGKDRMIRACR